MRDVLVRLEILAAWLKPGGQTPDEPIPDKYSTLVEAIAEIKLARCALTSADRPDVEKAGDCQS